MPKFVRDLMTRAIISAHPADSIESARSQLRDHGIHHLLVVENGNVLGVISPRDLMTSAKRTVGEVMHREVMSVEAGASLKRAAALMLGNPSGCLPVMEEGRLAGIITTSDLMRVFSLDETFA